MIEAGLAILLAVSVVLLVTGPLFPRRSARVEFEDPAPLEETRRGQALLALKDLEFDHATGKISDEDYQALRGRFAATAAAVLEDDADPAERLVAEQRGALAGGAAVRCRDCGPRPEPDARYCSRCGRQLA